MTARKNGRVKDVSMTSTALVNEDGRMYAIATTERMTGLSNEGSAV